MSTIATENLRIIRGKWSSNVPGTRISPKPRSEYGNKQTELSDMSSLGICSTNGNWKKKHKTDIFIYHAADTGDAKHKRYNWKLLIRLLINYKKNISNATLNNWEYFLTNSINCRYFNSKIFYTVSFLTTIFI